MALSAKRAGHGTVRTLAAARRVGDGVRGGLGGPGVPRALRDLRRMLDAYEAGDITGAREVHEGLMPVYRSMNYVGGVIFAKTALRLCGYETGHPRLPLPQATDEQVRVITSDLWDAGLVLVNPDAAAEVTPR